MTQLIINKKIYDEKKFMKRVLQIKENLTLLTKLKFLLLYNILSLT